MAIPLINGPNVYVNELPNPIRPIVGVPTSVAAFYGKAPQGRVDYPFPVNSWADYENEFGALSRDYPLSYAVYLFFLNGGNTALVIRYKDPAVPTASVQLSADITLDASSSGGWGTQLSATVDSSNLLPSPLTPAPFNLTITQTAVSPSLERATVATETYPFANLTPGTPRYLPTLLAASRLVTPAAGNKWTVAPSAVTGKAFTMPPAAGGAPAAGGGAAGAGGPAAAGGGAAGAGGPAAAGGGAAGAGGPAAAGGGAAASPSAGPASPMPLGDQSQKTGIYALAMADIFNILCLPADPAALYIPSDIDTAAKFCSDHRAMLIVDPPTSWTDPLDDFTKISSNLPFGPRSANAAVYYPNLTLTDSAGATFTAGPCGAVAGVWAATDGSRGVWKAPAGTAATISGITGFAAHVTDAESGTLNPLAINTLRTMPAAGPVVWGARTTVGTDQAASQWKYLPVRRLALYIEESLRRSLQWVVFEPNDEPLWSSIRLNVTTFMQGLFRQGAFEGSTAANAYLVQCDASNNPQDQIDLGIVNILVGFAPLYPAEFVIINIQQQAGQA